MILHKQTATIAAVLGAHAAAVPSRAQNSAPVRSLTPAVASDSGLISFVSAVRALSDGRVLVNDASRRRLLLFDSTLKAYTVIADATASGPGKYGAR